MSSKIRKHTGADEVGEALPVTALSEDEPLTIDARKQFMVCVAEYWGMCPSVSAAQLCYLFRVHENTISKWRKDELFIRAYMGARARAAGDVSSVAAAGRRYLDERAMQYAAKLDDLAMNAKSEAVQLKAAIKLSESTGVIRSSPQVGVSVALNMQAGMFVQSGEVMRDITPMPAHSAIPVSTVLVEVQE